jgi:hypothetical protein
MSTAMQDLIKGLKVDVELKFLKQKDVDRIIWYIETYHIPTEKQQIIDARISVTGLNHESPTDCNSLKDAETYYNQTYKKD